MVTACRLRISPYPLLFGRSPVHPLDRLSGYFGSGRNLRRQGQAVDGRLRRHRNVSDYTPPDRVVVHLEMKATVTTDGAGSRITRRIDLYCPSRCGRQVH